MKKISLSFQPTYEELKHQEHKRHLEILYPFSAYL